MLLPYSSMGLHNKEAGVGVCMNFHGMCMAFARKQVCVCAARSACVELNRPNAIVPFVLQVVLYNAAADGGFMI